MHISDKGVDFIKDWEKFRSRKYRDGGGYWTIGYGHLIKDGENYDDGITEEDALILLRADIRDAEDDVERLVTVELNQNQYDAVVSFFYNVGAPKLQDSRTLRYLNDGDYGLFADALLSWRKSGGKVLVGLERRRRAEREMFLS